MTNNTTSTLGHLHGLEMQRSMMDDRMALRLSATMLFGGVLLSLVAGMFHPGDALPNDHTAAFTEYAHSTHWTAIHLGQFTGMVVLITGLFALFFALPLENRALKLIARFGAISAGIALALYGVLQAVDGVALKQAVDAWLAAPTADKVVRFSGAETLRWLEWGVRSYQSFMLGLTFALFGIVIAGSGRLPRAIGYLMALSGVASIAQGWVLGGEGFSANNTLPTLLGILLTSAWSIWLLISAWGRQTAATGR